MDKVYNKYPDENLTSEKYLYYVKNFYEYRRMNIQYINKYMDSVLAVSDRVKMIALNMGINPDKLHLMYIGTKFADKQYKIEPIDIQKPYFRIIYMGYMRKDKGFYFLLDALERMDESIAKSIEVVLATKITDNIIIDTIKRISVKYHFVNIIDGYTHETLPEILKGVDLGLVPVLWEDNLPQVAIEMAAHGVPVLCSNLGGASELSSSELFRFEGGNQEEFIEKLIYLIVNKDKLHEYWNNYRGLKTMKDHIKELCDLYGFQ